MGEPLVHPKFNSFIEYCEKNDVKVFLVTNGFLLREEKVEALLNKTVEQVNFSLHSFFDNFPKEDSKNYLEKIFSFTELAFQRRPDLYINYRLWNLNEVEGVATQNLNILQAIEQRFQVKINYNYNVRKIKSKKIINRLYLNFDTKFIWPDLNLPKINDCGTCYGLRTHIGILVDGTVVPCCLDSKGHIPLGNLQKNSLLEILNSERAQKILQGFLKGVLVEDLCSRCHYIKRFQVK